MLWFLDYGTVW